MNAWIRLTHQSTGWVMLSPPRPSDGDRRRARPRRARRPRRASALTRARSSTDVPFERTTTASPFAIPRLSASAVESSTSRVGRWKPSSARARPRGPRRAACSAGVGVGPCISTGSGVVAAAGATYACLAGSGACRPRSSSVRSRNSPARSSAKTPAAWAGTSTSKRAASFEIHASSSGHGGSTARRRRWTRPSRFMEVPSRSSAAVDGQDQVGPAAGELVEHREHDHAVRLLGEHAHVGVRRGLVAGDDEELDRLRVGLVGVGRDRPAERDPVAGWTPREMERAAAGLLRESELVRELRDASHRRLRPGLTRSERRAPRRAASSRVRCAPTRARGRVRRRLRARSSRCRSASRRRPRRRACAPP